MSATNDKRKEERFMKEQKLAGGMGLEAAKQDYEGLLRRAVLSCLLWEDLAYESGQSVSDNIKELIPHVKPEVVAQIAYEARVYQKLRHVPLLIAREMCRLDSHKHLVGRLLPRIIQRADEINEFMAIYWKDGKEPISKQVKIGLKEALNNFGEYALAKYKGTDSKISLRDVMFMVHPKPKDEELLKKLAENSLATPNTWEVRLSSGEDKKSVWEDLIKTHQLGALAFLRNLRNMEEVGVTPDAINYGFETIKTQWLLPINYMTAAQASSRYESQIEGLMLRSLADLKKLPGYTIFVVDVSGSMEGAISGRSKSSRMDVACSMAMFAREVCEETSIYATAGNDGSRTHATTLIPSSRRGFGLIETIKDSRRKIGGGGIFTRQCLEYIREQETRRVDRIIIFSDSQDCDRVKTVPSPFGKYNYIVDVSSHAHGVNYKGVWTAEVSGWSEHFLTYIAAMENIGWNQEE
jgi:60 kDa SS-A/Ro ribonucleoprotein